VSTVAGIAIKFSNNLGIAKYYKAKLLDFLRVTLIFNNKTIKRNKILIMAKLQEK
jgi:hypothetical protein